MSQKIPPNYLVKTASITAAMSAAGAVAGLGLDAVILFWFGAGAQTDALFAALVIPTLLNGIVSIQGPKIWVPTFGAYFQRDESGAWQLLSNVLNVCGLLFGGVSLIGALLSGVIIPLQVPGLDAATLRLTVSLTAILFALVWFQGVSSLLQAVLYARHSYAISSAGKLIVNVMTIATVLVAGANHRGVETVAWGMVVGSCVQVVVFMGALFVAGFRYRLTLKLSDPELRSMLGSFGYPLLSHVLGESGTVVQSILASFLGSGSLTLLYYASRILATIGGILLGSVVQVTLPAVASATGDLPSQRRTLLEAIQILGLLAVPLTIWLAFTAEPLVVLFFQRGHFSSADAAATAVIIRAMVLYFLLARFVSVTQTLFFANSDFRTPFISTAIFAVANGVFAVLLVRWFGAAGVGWAISIAAVCNSVYMMAKVNSAYGPVGWGQLWPFVLRLGGISICAALAFAAGLNVRSPIPEPDILVRLSAVVIPSLLGFSIFGAGILLYRLFDTRSMAPAPAESGA